jgi:membrane protein
MLSPKRIYRCVYRAVDDTIKHDGVEHSGYFAFLAVLSLFPFLVFFFSVMGVLGETQTGVRLIDLILNNDVVPSHFLDALRPRINEIVSGPPQGLLTVAIIGAVWTASSGVEGLRTILNRAYRVSTPPAYIFGRLVSILQFLILTAILLFVTMMFIVLPNLWSLALQSLPIEEVAAFLDEYVAYDHIWGWFRYVLAIATLTAFVVITYKNIPNTKQSVKALLPGSLTVVVLWFAAGSLLSTYLSRFDQVNIIYGSLGGFIASLLFFYIAAMILIFGAELNYALERAQGHKVEEREKAVADH